jgi:hypothetical protein
VPLFQRAVGALNLVEGDHFGDRHFQLAGGYKSGQFGEHAGIRRVHIPYKLDAESFERGDVDDRIYAVWRDAQLGRGHLDTDAAEEAQEGVDPAAGRRSAEPIGEVVTVVNRDDAVRGQPLVV